MAYHDGQPFNDNMLRPCPMLENPEKLRDMVNETGAHSTDLQSPEDVDNLYGKCKPYADKLDLHRRPPVELLPQLRQLPELPQRRAEITPSIYIYVSAYRTKAVAGRQRP